MAYFIQNTTFQGLVITDGIARSFAIFTYQCSRNGNSLLCPTRSDAEAPAHVGFQGGTNFSHFHPLCYLNNTGIVCGNNNSVSSWSNLLYQLAPKPPHGHDTSKHNVIILVESDPGLYTPIHKYCVLPCVCVACLFRLYVSIRYQHC